jgi:hypothetical protein
MMSTLLDELNWYILGGFVGCLYYAFKLLGVWEYETPGEE